MDTPAGETKPIRFVEQRDSNRMGSIAGRARSRLITAFRRLQRGRIHARAGIGRMGCGRACARRLHQIRLRLGRTRTGRRVRLLIRWRSRCAWLMRCRSATARAHRRRGRLRVALPACPGSRRGAWLLIANRAVRRAVLGPPVMHARSIRIARRMLPCVAVRLVL